MKNNIRLLSAVTSGLGEANRILTSPDQEAGMEDHARSMIATLEPIGADIIARSADPAALATNIVASGSVGLIHLLKNALGTDIPVSNMTWRVLMTDFSVGHVEAVADAVGDLSHACDAIYNHLMNGYPEYTPLLARAAAQDNFVANRAIQNSMFQICSDYPAATEAIIANQVRAFPQRYAWLAEEFAREGKASSVVLLWAAGCKLPTPNDKYGEQTNAFLSLAQSHHGQMEIKSRIPSLQEALSARGLVTGYLEELVLKT